jgi:hypothetical protein
MNNLPPYFGGPNRVAPSATARAAPAVSQASTSLGCTAAPPIAQLPIGADKQQPQPRRPVHLSDLHVLRTEPNGPVSTNL